MTFGGTILAGLFGSASPWTFLGLPRFLIIVASCGTGGLLEDRLRLSARA